MAKRKRTETISLRVDRGIKLRIEALTAVRELSATSMLEQLIYHSAQEQLVMPGEAAKPIPGCDGLISLEDAITSAEHEIAALIKIRLYFLAPSAVSTKDKFIILTILDNLDIFSGITQVFDEQDHSALFNPSFKSPALDIAKLEKYEGVLEKWHEFRVKNPSFNFTFESFISIANGA